MDEPQAMGHQIASVTVSESDLVYAYTNASYQPERASMTVSESDLASVYTNASYQPNNMNLVPQGVVPVATSLYSSLSQPVCHSLSQIYAVDRLFQVWECRNHHIWNKVCRNLSQPPYMEQSLSQPVATAIYRTRFVATCCNL